MRADVTTLRTRHVDLLEAELPRIVEELKRLGAHLIVLFGSYAQGRRDLFTDLDLLVVMDSAEPFVERLAAVRAAVRPRVPTDLFVYTPEEFERMKKQPFVKHALATGTILHAAT